MPPDDNAPLTTPTVNPVQAPASRKAQIAEALKLIPANTRPPGGEGEDDGDDEVPEPAPAVPPTPAPAAAAAATPAEEPPPAASATPEAEPPPNPLEAIAGIQAENLELKKAIKRLSDQLSAPKDVPGQGTGPEAPAVTQAELINNPVEALKKLGLSYHDLTERIVAGGPTVTDALTQAERVRQDALQAAEAVRGEVKMLRNQLTRERLELDFAKALADPRFDLLSSDQETAITQGISEMARHFQETGERLSEAQTLAIVQRQWVDKLKKLNSRGAAAKLLGIQSGTPVPATPPAAAAQTPSPAAAPPATLTNDVHASSLPGEASRSTGSKAIDRKQFIRDTVRKLVPPNATAEEE